jgi:hypothetical protein
VRGEFAAPEGLSLAGRCAGVSRGGAANVFPIHHLTVVNSLRTGARRMCS